MREVGGVRDARRSDGVDGVFEPLLTKFKPCVDLSILIHFVTRTIEPSCARPNYNPTAPGWRLVAQQTINLPHFTNIARPAPGQAALDGSDTNSRR